MNKPFLYRITEWKTVSDNVMSGVFDKANKSTLESIHIGLRSFKAEMGKSLDRVEGLIEKEKKRKKTLK